MHPLLNVGVISFSFLELSFAFKKGTNSKALAETFIAC